MKKLAFQVLTSLLMVMMLLSLIQMPVEASTNDKKFIIQKEEKEFIIYYKDLCNNQFNFAFSTNKNESKDDLVFITSVEDKLQDEKLNVAYTNENLYDTYFKDNENKAYIWIKDSEGKYKVEAELIDLTQDVMTDEQIEYVKLFLGKDYASFFKDADSFVYVFNISHKLILSFTEQALYLDRIVLPD